MDTLPDLVPEGVELSSYVLTEGTRLVLTGAATNPSVVQLFISELSNSGLIEAPTPSEPLLRETGTLYDFQITGTLRQES